MAPTHATALGPAGSVAEVAQHDGPETRNESSAGDAKRVRIGVLDFDALSEAAAVTLITSAAASGRGGWVVTPNADILRLCTRDPSLRALAGSAQLVLADGAPVVWASTLAGNPLPERVTGSSLMFSLTRAAADQCLGVFLLGGMPGVAKVAAQRLQGELPTLGEVRHHCPPFGFEQSHEELERIESAVRGSNARVVFVGLGFPKQERLIAHLRPSFPDRWFVACGAGIGFVAGETSRAPTWAQRSGMEWVFRLAQEPRRLARRYLVHDLPFVFSLLARSLLLRRQR